MAKLIFLGEKFAGRVYELAIEKTTVGRGDHNTLTIQDPSVSHSHCEILVYGTEVIVRDVGSSNGTVVDGKRLFDHEQRPLDNGQIVKFGLVEARLELISASESDTTTGLTGFHAHARHLSEPNESKPANSVASKSAGAPAPAHDDHTLIVPAPPPPPVAPKPVQEPAVNAVSEKSGGNKGLIFVVAVIGLGLVILFWLFLTKYR